MTYLNDTNLRLHAIIIHRNPRLLHHPLLDGISDVRNHWERESALHITFCPENTHTHTHRVALINTPVPYLVQFCPGSLPSSPCWLQTDKSFLWWGCCLWSDGCPEIAHNCPSPDPPPHHHQEHRLHLKQQQNKTSKIWASHRKYLLYGNSLANINCSTKQWVIQQR